MRLSILLQSWYEDWASNLIFAILLIFQNSAIQLMFFTCLNLSPFPQR